MRSLLPALALIAAAPLAAQEGPAGMDVPEAETEAAPDGTGLEEVMGMMAGLFGTEPLTPQEEARLPAASGIAATIMPDGFYGEMMGEIMSYTIEPMLTMFTGPDFVIAQATGADMAAISALPEERQRDIALMLDPAYETRSNALVEGMTRLMTEAMGAVEGPMRDGLSRAYAKRFDAQQLGEIAAFFATDTGALYATESMRIFADPEVMSASMSAMPAMLGGVGDFAERMEALEASQPKARGFDDLTQAQRATIAEALGVSVTDLRESMSAVAEAAAAAEDAEAALMEDMAGDAEE